MIDLSVVRGWVFDVDDTLYLEREYVISGFYAVGRWISRTHGVENFTDAAVKQFEQGVRGRTFDLALRSLGIDATDDLIAAMVEQYRAHVPTISMLADASSFIKLIARKAQIGIITDGPVESQSRKIAVLGLGSLANAVVLTDKWGIEFRKPHERAFIEVERALKLEGSSLVYVADNPAKDFDAPRKRGWQTVRVRRPGGQHHHVVVRSDLLDMEVNSFAPIEAMA